ncbi:MAG: hypothetical protein M9882_06645 [Homoserinimonas sp.]|nr:hypothetical protein [Homoserinimonas sp.]
MAAGLAGGLGPDDFELLGFELLVAGLGAGAFAAGVLAGLVVLAAAGVVAGAEAAAGVAVVGAGWAAAGAVAVAGVGLALAAVAADATGAGGRC